MIARGVAKLREFAELRQAERVLTGVAPFDRLSGGLIRGGICELTGAEGSSPCPEDAFHGQGYECRGPEPEDSESATDDRLAARELLEKFLTRSAPAAGVPRR